jgi:rare lipoprotein A
MKSWKVTTALFATVIMTSTGVLPAYSDSVGTASYYGKGFNGRRAANGEVFNMHAMTAAHRSLPFGTRLQVTNMKNGRSVVVRIQDRGPYVRGRVLDLSYGAARALDMIATGTAKVKMVAIGAKTPAPATMTVARR